MINKVFNLKEADDKGFVPTLTTYVTDDTVMSEREMKPRKRGAVLICPGGGYGMCSPREGEPIAIMFNAAGYNAFVIEYSVAPHRYPEALSEVSESMRIIRENAEEWGIDENKIAVCGFSAGAHLAGSLATLWNKEPAVKSADKMNKPNAAILCYPVITSGEMAHRGSFDNLLGENKDNEEMLSYLSLEKQVSADTPPTFLWHAFDDTCVPVENSLMFAEALKKNEVPFEMHIYPKGGHGGALANKLVCPIYGINPHLGTWAKLACEWLDLIFKSDELILNE